MARHAKKRHEPLRGRHSGEGRNPDYGAQASRLHRKGTFLIDTFWIPAQRHAGMTAFIAYMVHEYRKNLSQQILEWRNLAIKVLLHKWDNYTLMNEAALSFILCSIL